MKKPILHFLVTLDAKNLGQDTWIQYQPNDKIHQK